jgi:hypothetical protein
VLDVPYPALRVSRSVPAAGIDVKTVQTWLGHASAELTLNLYGHHLGTDADRAGIARVNAILKDVSEDAVGTRELAASERKWAHGEQNPA